MFDYRIFIKYYWTSNLRHLVVDAQRASVNTTSKFCVTGTSLVVQWLRLPSQYRSAGFDPGSGSWIPYAETKSPHAATRDPAWGN